MLKKNRMLNFLLFIPILNAIANITTNYFTNSQMNPGNIRAIILVIFSIYFFITHKKINLDKLNKSLIFYVLFLNILVVFASNKFFSFMLVTKVSLSIISFIIYRHYFKDYHQFRKLIYMFYFALLIYDFNFIISQIFKIGVSDYLSDSFYTGGAGVSANNLLSMFVLVMPIIYIKGKEFKRILFVVTIIISVILIFFSLRRSGIIFLLVGFLIQMYYNKTKALTMIGYILLISITYFAFKFTVGDKFEERLSARQERQLRYYDSSALINTEEGRFQDPVNAYNKLKKEGVLAMIFGREVFNTRKFLGSHRELHNGYAALLAGTGFLGVLLFLRILLMIFKKLYQAYKHSTYSIEKKSTTVVLSIFISFIVFLFATRLHNYALPYYSFSLFGALIGINENRNRQNEHV